MPVKIEFEMYAGDWIEMDPHDLYDDQLVSLADRLEQGTIRIEDLKDTVWNLWDFTIPARPIRVVETA